MNICILKEKREDEKRTALIPQDIIKLKKKFPDWIFYIEPSSNRIVQNKEYYNVGCKKYASQKIDLFISVKEVSIRKIKNILNQKPTINDLISQIKKYQLNDLKILVTGDGQASKGAQYFLKKIGLSNKSSKNKSYFNSFYQIIPPNKFYKRMDKKYNLNDLLKGKGVYESIFDRYLGKYNILLACHFWNENFPKLFNVKDIDENFFEIIGDITCDINGSIPTTIKSTNLKSPYYKNQNVTIMAVDNLPSALPLETSKYFSNRLLKLLPKIIKSLNQDTIEEYFISKKGYLNYRYLNLLNYLIDG